MSDRGWHVQIYTVTDATAREFVASLLSGVDGLAVESTDDGFKHFLIVESSDESQARSVHQLVTSTDAGAVLLHTAHGPEAPRVLTAA